MENKWFLYHDLERKILESGGVKQFKFSEFKEKPASKVYIMLWDVTCGKRKLEQVCNSNCEYKSWKLRALKGSSVSITTKTCTPWCIMAN